MSARSTNQSLLLRLAKQIKAKMPRTANRLLAYPKQPPINPELMARIDALAQERTTPLSLLDLYRYGQNRSTVHRLRAAQFLHMELPRRIAKRVVELRSLPLDLVDKRGIRDVMGWYSSYVDELLSFPKPKTEDEEYDFTCLLASILCDHTSVPRALASGIQEYREGISNDELVQDPAQKHIENILTGFYTARIGLRFLVEHHIVTREEQPGYSGIIASHCSPCEVARAAARDVERVCRTNLGAAPPIKILGKDSDVFCYVPSHLYFMVSETLKNACRATVEKHLPAYSALKREQSMDWSLRSEARRQAMIDPTLSSKLPPVKIVVAMGDEDVTIKVADEGGGVARSDMGLLWTFFYTTFPVVQDEQSLYNSELQGNRPSRVEVPNVGTESVLAGHGMGLPLSRIYARYFGGDLEVKSLEGFGMDSYLHLCKLGNRCEDLGLQVMCSPSMRDSTP